ncbi:MAG TPA: hypothetical protein PLU22_04090 [Polyangiaceae bacterium]|nr:hypothetical protein [Polyangiaceae bacterium]
MTTEPVDERNPAISPDGRVLLFQSIAREGVFEKRTLVAVDPSTRAQRTLFTSDKPHSRDPAWIAGGTSYLYVSDSPGSPSIVRALTAAPNAAISVVAAGEIAPSPAHPSISPDGTRVAFETAGKIAVSGLDGSRLTLLGEGVSPDWSPDGRLVAFCRAVGTSRHLFVADPDTGTGLVQLTSDDYDHCAPSWSPDGQFIVFSTDRARAEGGEVALGTGVRNLYIIKHDGTELTELTSGSVTADEPDWGADGWIYFTSNQEGNFDIWRLLPTGRYAGAPAPSGARAARRDRRAAARGRTGRVASGRAGSVRRAGGAAAAAARPEHRGLHQGHGLQGRSHLREGDLRLARVSSARRRLPRVHGSPSSFRDGAARAASPISEAGSVELSRPGRAAPGHSQFLRCGLVQGAVQSTQSSPQKKCRAPVSA